MAVIMSGVPCLAPTDASLLSLSFLLFARLWFAFPFLSICLQLFLVRKVPLQARAISCRPHFVFFLHCGDVVIDNSIQHFERISVSRFTTVYRGRAGRFFCLERT